MKTYISFGGIVFSDDTNLFDTITLEEATKLTTINGRVAPRNNKLRIVQIDKSGRDITIKSKTL